MQFDYEAYEKVFPGVTTDQAAAIDSAVDGYTPTADEASGNASKEDINTVPAADDPEPSKTLPKDQGAAPETPAESEQING